METSNELLSRPEFKRAVFARDGEKCVFCGEPAVDAHHILDRKLWKDGGYYLDNGASVCSDCHWKCEKNLLSTRHVREACGITQVLLPPGLDPAFEYDKWGKCILCHGEQIYLDEDGTENLCTKCEGNIE